MSVVDIKTRKPIERPEKVSFGQAAKEGYDKLLCEAAMHAKKVRLEGPKDLKDRYIVMLANELTKANLKLMLQTERVER